MNFRYAQTWGLAIPYKGSTVTIHANMGGTSDSSTTLSSSFAECKAGGGNFKLSTAGVYEVTLKLELRSVKFTGKAVCTDEDTSSAKLPEKMYMTGSPYNWDWTLATELIPVHSHDGNFWGVYYLNANDMLKFNSARDWNGDQFGAESSAAIGYGDYATGESDITIANSGFYLVWVQCSLSADKKSVINRFVLAEPVPYLVGACAPGGWDDICSNAAKFTLDNNVYKSPAFANDGELRMCILLDGVEWWQSEFMIFDGQIVYRGADKDQERINGVAGQIATLDFINNTGTIQ